MTRAGDGSTLSLDFTTGVLDPRITFSRADATALATFTNSLGYVTFVSTAQAPRFDYDPDPTKLTAKGLLLEAPATNYMLQSTTLNPHSTFNMRTIATASITDPEGTTDKARIIAADGTTAIHGRYLLTTAGTNTTVTISIFAKKNGYKYLYLADIANSRSAVRFDLDDGTTSNSVGAGFVSALATPYPNGWWRCSMVATVSASTAYGWSYVGVPTTGATLNAVGASYAGANTDTNGIYCYGFQVEAGSRASSYIQTTTATVSRAVDTAIIAAGANFNSWYTGGTTGTFVANWYANAASSTARTVIATNDETNKHLHLYQTPSALTLRLADHNAVATVTTANSMTAGALTKGAFSYASTATNLCLNGGTVASGTLAFSSAPTWLSIGGPSTNGTSITSTDVMLNNSIRSIKYWPTVLPNTTLQSLTT
jgi:hypothetical protein